MKITNRCYKQADAGRIILHKQKKEEKKRLGPMQISSNLSTVSFVEKKLKHINSVLI